MHDLDLDLNTVHVPLRWSELFGRDAPTEIEIGSGKGRFLLELAARYPERNLLAVERAGKYHKLCCDRAAKRGITSVRLLRTTAEDLLFRLVAPASVDTFYVLFPDPWPKKRHHKRRFFKPETVTALGRALKPGGLLLVKSDHADYAEVIGEVLDAADGFETLDTAEAFAALPLTGFECKYLEQGREIFPFALRRVI
jgi:tRNA (guanine-N7-)-methyltransferase